MAKQQKHRRKGFAFLTVDTIIQINTIVKERLTRNTSLVFQMTLPLFSSSA